MTVGEIARAAGGAVIGAQRDAMVSGFSIDTRTLQPGDLFLAIRGERFDGHVFVAEAARKGAAAVMVIDASVVPPGIPAVAVDDTVTGLQTLAREVRRSSGAKVVAVTGSAGKSTTKEVTAEFLAARYRVFRNKGNLNNHIGLPLSLLELRHKPDVGVVELGMNHYGEISALVKIAEPDVRVWTNVGPAHLEFFGTEDAVAEAKAEIMEGARPQDLLVANADDDRVMRHAARFSGRVTTFGLDRPADIRATQIHSLGVEGMRAQVQTPAGSAALITPLPGMANLSNVLAGTAVALAFDVPLSSVVERAAGLRPVARRGEVIRVGGLTIVDDSYNSNPKALQRALEVVAKESRFTRRLAVIGEMLELGEASGALHRASGRLAAASGLAALVAVGSEPARQFRDGAIEGGMSPQNAHYVPTSQEAADLVATLVQPGDLVLVKGSRGIRTDLVVDRLRAEIG